MQVRLGFAEFERHFQRLYHRTPHHRCADAVIPSTAAPHVEYGPSFLTFAVHNAGDSHYLQHTVMLKQHTRSAAAVLLLWQPAEMQDSGLPGMPTGPPRK